MSELFTLKIVSWENDGDDYKTTYQHGLTAADVAFITALADQFSSRSAHCGGYGNEEWDADTLVEMIAEVLGEHPDVSADVRDTWTFAEGQEQYVYERLYEEVLGWPVQYDYKFCRVVESVTSTAYLPPVVEGHTMEWVRKNHEEAYKVLRESEEQNRVWALKWQEQADEALKYRQLLQKTVDLYNSPDHSHIDYMNFLGVLKVILEGSEAEQLVALLKIGSEQAAKGNTISGEELMEKLQEKFG